jgi:transcriptional regulator with XRE-family HTH domain
MQGDSSGLVTTPDDLTARFAARLRQLQAAGEVSERELARASGLGASTVRRLLAGEAEPRLSTMVALAGALRLASLEQFLGPFATETLIRRL